MPTRPVVELQPWEYMWAHTVGALRDSANLHKQDSAYYDPERMEHNLIASRAAAVAEMVVAKYLGLYWGGHVWDSAQHDHFRMESDVGDRIEVRRIRRAQAPLTVRKRDLAVEGRIVVSVFVDSQEQTSGQIMGWLPAVDAWEQGRRPDHSDPKDETRAVDYPFLNDIADLLPAGVGV
jgi:hypothetical protein